MKQISEALSKAIKFIEAESLGDVCLELSGGRCPACLEEKALLMELRNALEAAKENGKAPTCVGCGPVKKHGVRACEKCKMSAPLFFTDNGVCYW